MKKQFQSNLDGMTLGGGSIEHPLSIHSASIGTRWHSRGMQLICTLVLLFTFAVGNVWGAYDVPADGTVTLSQKVNNGGRFNVEASGVYHFRTSSGYSWDSSNGIKTQSNEGGVVFYLDASKEIEVGIVHTEAKNAHDVTVHVYSITESVYKQFDDNKAGAAESNRTFSTAPTSSTDGSFTISITAESKTFTGKKTLAAGYYAVVPVGEKSKTFFKTIKFTTTGGTTPVCPSGLSISGTKNYTEGQKIELTAALEAGNGAITYQWYKGGTAEANKLTGKTAAKLEIASCTGSDAGDYYCKASKSDCSGAVNAEAYTVTVATIQPTGTATISYALSGSTTTGTVTGVNSISSLSSSLNLSTLTLSGTKDGYSGGIKGCTSTTELVDADYVDVQFTVANGYVFTPSAVTVRANPLGNTGALKAVVKVMDAQPLEVASNELACAKNTDNAVTFASGAFTNKKFVGTVHLRMYFYGAASDKTFYLKSPISITGTVAVAPTKYNVYFLKNDEGASGSQAMLQYEAGAEVTLPACTFDAPTGKEFDAWTSTDVTISNGKFTMPSNAVTIKATWKALTTKYTVTYKEGTTTLGTEQVTVGGNPADAGDYEDKNLASFVDWYSNADLAEEHKIADISALVVTKDTTVYGKWTYTYATSANIEQWVLDNGTSYNAVAQLGALHYASNITNSLDSLNDSKGTGRNYAYLGLKVKSGGKMLDFRLANGQTVKVKLGATGNYPQVALNGGSYAAMSLTDNVWAYTATGEDYISIKTSNDNTVVIKQIMINEDIQDVTLPEATRHAVVLTKAGETEHGTLAVASPETYNWLAEGAAVTLSVAVDDGYYIESVKLNGDALTPSENVYSFAMPNAVANVVATFAEVVPNNVTYKANGGIGDDILVENATEIAGCTFTAPANTKFDGWNTDPDGNGDAYAAGDPVLSPLTLYAQWREYFVITYKDDDDVLDTEDVFVGEAPVGIADPVKAFNIFKGWTLSGSDEVIDVTTLTTSTTVYAKWEAIDACFYYLPTKPAEAVQLAVDALVPGAEGGSMKVLGDKIYNSPYGLSFESSGSAAVLVTLSRNMEAGTVIKSKVVANVKNTDARGLLLRNAANSATVQEWTHVPTQDPDTFEFTYTVQANDGLAGTNQFCIKRSTNAWLISLMVSNCAPEQFTVTYKDGENTLGTEGVYENGHPTASKIYTRKPGYVLDGWSLTNGGDIVELSTITITEDKTLYAKYLERDCSPMGVKFSQEAKTNEMTADYQPDGNTILSLADYATISGGEAYVGNGSSSKHVKVLQETSEIKLTGTAGFIRILLDCPLAANDTIKLDKTNKCVVSVDSLKAKKASLASGTHYCVVSAEWVEATRDTIYIWRDGNDVTFTSIQVIRPEIYAVSFNLMGHGSAIAPVDVVKGAKIVAPTAPTDEDYAFAGWYKENTLSNEWDFDNDVVAANTTLYAKWIDMSDATLKSLKYGATDIALQDGVYEYNVELPALTTAVPALTAETSNPNATKEITDATAFDAEGHATSTVVVTPEKVGAATQTYTVNFSKAAAVELQDVTGSITWDFNGAVTADVNINNTLTVIANYAGVSLDGADKLEVKGTKFMKSPACVRANQMHFYTTVPGKLTVEYSNTGGNAVRYLYVNGVKYDEAGTESTAKKGGDTKVFVPAGDVELVMMDGSDVSKELNIYRIIFNATPDYERPVSNNIGTLCVEHNVPAGQYFGATFYQIASRNELYNDKIDFEEVLPTEELKAGEPYIFQSTTGKIELFFGETKADAPVAVRGMIGNYDAGELDITEENKTDILYIAQNKLWTCENLVGSHLTLNDHRAYIKMSAVPEYTATPSPSPAPRRRVTLGRNGENTATGIEMTNDQSQITNKVLINGQLFIIRGEKMFDATGRLVK